MKLIPILLLALAAVPAISACADAQPAPARPAAAADSVRALLPVGTLRVDVMDMAASPRMNELTQRLQAAAQANQAWFQEAIRRSTPGEPLPYDPRLGMTEAEYQEYLGLARSLTLRKVAEAQLTVREEGARLVFDGGSSFPDLTGVAIDLASDELLTPLGTVRGSKPLHVPEGTAAGAWDGVRWRLEELSADAADGKVISLSLGRRREDGRGILYWELREIRGGRPVRRMVRILYYGLPAR